MKRHIRNLCVFGIIIVSMAFIGCPADFQRDNPNDREQRGYPTIASISPSDGAEAVAVDSNIVIRFTEPMVKECNWSISVEGILYNKESAGVTWDEAGTVLTIVPTVYFSRASHVDVFLFGFSAMDAATTAGEMHFTFSVADALPTASLSPIDGQENVPGDRYVFVNFSEEMVTSNDWTVKVGDVIYDKDSPCVSWNATSTMITIDPAEDFTRSSKINVALNRFLAAKDGWSLTGKLDYYFYITESPFPVVSLITPDNNDTGIPIDSKLTIEFSEKIAHSFWSVKLDNVTYNESSTAIKWNDADNILTITPSLVFARNKNVAVQLDGFVSALDNAPLADYTPVSFTTSDVLPSASFNPTHQATGVSMSSPVVITFSEKMITDNGWKVDVDTTTYNKNSDPARISWSGDGTVLTITPASIFMRNAVVPVSLNSFVAFVDSYPLTGSAAYYFTTESPAAPKVASIDPADGSIGVVVDKTVKITFSEQMNTASGWSVVLGGVTYDQASCPTCWYYNTVNKSHELTIDPSGNFTRGATVSADLYNFKAALDNAPLATESTHKSFTVKTAPTASCSPDEAYSDSDTVYGVRTDYPVVLTFSEPMSQSGWSVNINGTNYTSGSWSGNTLTITPSGLPVNSKITVSLSNFKAAVDSVSMASPTVFYYSTRWNTKINILAYQFYGRDIPQGDDCGDECGHADVELYWQFNSQLNGGAVTVFAYQHYNCWTPLGPLGWITSPNYVGTTCSPYNAGNSMSSVEYSSVPRSSGQTIRLGIAMSDQDTDGREGNSGDDVIANWAIFDIAYNAASDTFGCSYGFGAYATVKYASDDTFQQAWSIPNNKAESSYFCSFVSSGVARIIVTLKIKSTPVRPY